jgi:hypothetical protein
MRAFFARLGISAACYRMSHTWWGAVLMHVVNGLFFDRNHCRKAFDKQGSR